MKISNEQNSLILKRSSYLYWLEEYVTMMYQNRIPIMFDVFQLKYILLKKKRKDAISEPIQK
jgi:hypothetical protein